MYGRELDSGALDHYPTDYDFRGYQQHKITVVAEMFDIRRKWMGKQIKHGFILLIIGQTPQNILKV